MEESQQKPKRACIVVLGDFGRSPRMQYHTISLLKRGLEVDVVATSGTTPRQELMDQDKLSLHLMKPIPNFASLPRPLALALRLLLQSFLLLWTLLWYVKNIDMVIVQNPPSVPTLPVIWIYCKLTSTRFILDWHNYGYSILALGFKSKNHPLVKLYRWLEETFGKKADLHFCVSEAMKKDLHSRLGIQAYVLYDRPSNCFSPNVPAEIAHSLFVKLAQMYPAFQAREQDLPDKMTAFTKCSNDHKPIFRQDRPMLVISSTSWTEDEDFGILLEALKIYDSFEEDTLPDIVCVVTGRGPLKDHYTKVLKNSGEWRRIKFALPWLCAEDYPLLLSCADLGISLHASSSGVDLPMKVVDMFGSGIPVLALDFPALSELVQPHQNGNIFTSPSTLASLLKDLLGEPDQKTLHLYRKSLQDFGKLGWEENWEKVVAPVLL